MPKHGEVKKKPIFISAAFCTVPPKAADVYCVLLHLIILSKAHLKWKATSWLMHVIGSIITVMAIYPEQFRAVLLQFGQESCLIFSKISSFYFICVIKVVFKIMLLELLAALILLELIFDLFNFFFFYI